MSQKKLVLDFIARHGSITSLQAFEFFGITRLADVIFKLRKAGNVIFSETVHGKNRYGNPVHYARYWM